MPAWMLDVDAFMLMYPGLTPADVIDMDVDCFEWLPVVRAARVQAAGMSERAHSGPAVFGLGGR